MRMTTAQKQQMVNVLLRRVPSHNELERLMTYYVDVPLAQVTGSGPLGEVATRLVDWLDRNERASDMMRGLTAEKERCEDVWALAADLAASGVMPPIARRPVVVQAAPPPSRSIYVPPPPPVYIPPPPPLPAEITGRELGQLSSILSDMGIEVLNELALLAYNKRLNTFASTSNTSSAAYDLLRYAQSRDGIDKIVHGALHLAPDSRALKDLRTHLVGRGVMTARSPFEDAS